MTEWEAFDIETVGMKREYALQPWRVDTGNAWIRSWAVSRGITNYTFPARAGHFDQTQAQLRALLSRWVEQGTLVATWNATFEISWMAAYGLADLAMKVKWIDGMLLWRHLENMPEYEVAATKRRSFGLKAAVAEHFPEFEGYGDDIDFGGDLLTLMHYNALDTQFTLRLTKMFYELLEERSPRQLRCAMIETHSLAMAGIANHNGLPVHMNNLKRLDRKLDLKLNAVGQLLESYGATREILTSPKQLADLLFNQWGLTPVKQGKTGASTDKETLVTLATTDARARAVMAYREAAGNRVKFVTNVRQSVGYNGDDRTHPSARVFGTYTGRLTYASKQGKGVRTAQTGFALHQMKRAKHYRQLIKAPKGHVVIELDAAGQEFRWMSILSGDPVMQQLCMPGEDPHAYMGAQVGGVDYREVQAGHDEDTHLKRVRQMGKVANLSLQFRTSAATLLRTAIVQHGMSHMTPALAEKIHRTYRGTYREVPKYWDKQIAIMRYQHFVQTLAGRRVYVSPEMVRRYGWSIESTSINFPVQGTGGDQKYLAMSVIRPVLAQFDSTFAFDLHDGLYFMVPESNANDFITTARQLFDNLPYEKAWGFTPPIPLPWDVKAGPTWGDMVELKIGDTL